MKKKLLLFLCLFLFITNVKALTFNVNITNIEDKGNNGTVGSISDIDVENKTLNALFQNIGDEVSFSVTITNSGDRAGTLKSIGVTSTNDKISYTTNLPEGGLSINGNDTNSVTITAKVLEGATSGTSTSTIKITYNYDEGNCPEGETLSTDESMCLCPEGYERNQSGVCVQPETKVTCEDDEIYNETKKICEKKITCKADETYNETKKICEKKIECKEDEIYNANKKICEKIIKCKEDEIFNAVKNTCEKKDIPVVIEEDPPKSEPVITVSNPKTLDNIVLIVLLFIVSGLGIYAALFKKLKTKKNKTVAGLIIGFLTLGTSLTVLVGVFGIDKLLGAVINPVTRSTELTLTVNETIDMIETWNGRCSKSSLTAENIFDGGTGTSDDPYQIKTADQLACFAKSINNGTTYNYQYIKQTRNIILNDNLIENIENGTTDNLHYWTTAGNTYNGRYFGGTYDGDNHVISGMWLNDNSMNKNAAKGLFGYAKHATFKNMILSDVYIGLTNGTAVGGLLAKAEERLIINNVKTYGKIGMNDNGTINLPGGINEYNSDGGIVGFFEGSGNNIVTIENSENNISPVTSGIIGQINKVGVSDSPNIILRNVVNNGDFISRGGVISVIIDNYYNGGNVLFDNVVNNGNRSYSNHGGTTYAGVVGSISAQKVVIQNSGNTGNVFGNTGNSAAGGIAGGLNSSTSILVDNCYNSGNITFGFAESYLDGLTANEVTTLRNGNPGANIGGLVGVTVVPADNMATIKDSYNSGTLSGLSNIGGIISMSKNPSDRIDGNLTIDNCYNTGAIRAGDGFVGGLAADTKGTIQDSHNSGTITVFGYRNSYTQLSGGSYSTGTPIGGLVGKNNNLTWDSTFTGANIIDSYNEGDILITAKTDTVNVGGICGICGSISGSHNSGNITSKYATQYFDGTAFRVFNTPTDTYFDGEIVTENLTY